MQELGLAIIIHEKIMRASVQSSFNDYIAHDPPVNMNKLNETDMRSRAKLTTPTWKFITSFLWRARPDIFKGLANLVLNQAHGPPSGAYVRTRLLHNASNTIITILRTQETQQGVA